MLSLIAAALVTFTMPTEYIDGRPLPAETRLLAAVFNNADTDNAVAAVAGYPGEVVSVQTENRYGCWIAKAWTVQVPVPSIFTEPVCKSPPPCSGCH